MIAVSKVPFSFPKQYIFDTPRLEQLAQLYSPRERLRNILNGVWQGSILWWLIHPSSTPGSGFCLLHTSISPLEAAGAKRCCGEAVAWQGPAHSSVVAIKTNLPHVMQAVRGCGCEELGTCRTREVTPSPGPRRACPSRATTSTLPFGRRPPPENVSLEPAALVGRSHDK